MLPPQTVILILTLADVVLLRGLRRYFALFWMAALPGVVLHELSHWTTALFTNGQPSFPRFWPQKIPGGYSMARVPILNPRWYNGVFIGLSPLLLIVIAFATIVYGSPQTWSWAQAWRVVIIPIIAAECLVECVPSPADWRIAGKSLWPLLAAVACVLVFRVST